MNIEITQTTVSHREGRYLAFDSVTGALKAILPTFDEMLKFAERREVALCSPGSFEEATS